MKKIRFGMIGGGLGAFIGDAHRRASRISNRFELLGGAFDADYEKGKEFAQSEGLDLSRCYATIDDFISGELSLPADERIESVAIVTPNFLHFPCAKALLENGFHVMCEKPMTMTVEEAEELQGLVEKSGLAFALAHTYTGYPMVREMRELIKQGILGDIQRVDAQYYQGWVNSIIHGRENKITGVWRLEPEYSGISSCMGDIGVHAFNMLEYATGLEVKSVLSDLNNVHDSVKMDLDGTVLLRFDGKLKGVIRASQVAAGEENGFKVAIYGSKASFRWEQENPNELLLLSDTEPARIYKPGNSYNTEFADQSHTMPAGHPEGIYESLANIYSGFAKSVRNESYTEGEFPTVNDGVRGMMFIHSVVKSNKESNSWVDL
ncbi:MAG: Gfo/Idh/MocA family oxidoreductase [Bacteroides sp.]|nr:Gfo/Idh/MocA family oxidoreductase [Bacteroides sp.]